MVIGHKGRKTTLRLLSITNVFSFLIEGRVPACHVFEFTIQVMLSIAVISASIIWIVTPIASTMTIKAEFIAGSMLTRCFIIISVKILRRELRNLS